MGRAEHVAVDGSVVVFEGDVDLAYPVTSSVRYQADGILRELTSCPVDAADSLGITVDEEYAYQGGTLRIGHRDDTDPSLGSRRRDVFALWRGTAHALVLGQTNGTAEGLIGVLDTLTIAEQPEGVSVTGDALQGATTRLVKELPGIGLAEVAPLVPEVARSLPRWGGTETTGGDLYRDEARADVPVLILVGESAATTFLIDSPEEADAATARVAGMEITWARS